tara:strand:- start:1983 stop:2495 length:513 start_codon:yes stop_codon:yes gene_type:complete
MGYLGWQALYVARCYHVDEGTFSEARRLEKAGTETPDADADRRGYLSARAVLLGTSDPIEAADRRAAEGQLRNVLLEANERHADDPLAPQRRDVDFHRYLRLHVAYVEHFDDPLGTSPENLDYHCNLVAAQIPDDTAEGRELYEELLAARDEKLGAVIGPTYHRSLPEVS